MGDSFHTNFRNLTGFALFILQNVELAPSFEESQNPSFKGRELFKRLPGPVATAGRFVDYPVVIELLKVLSHHEQVAALVPIP